MIMIVHYIPIPASRVDRLVWLLEELGVEYVMKAHPMKGPVAPSMQALSKLGKTPVLEVNGKILSETGFIVHYLMTHYPHALEGTPSDSSVFWSFFSEGSLMLHLQPGRIVGMAASVLPNKPGTTPEQGQGITTMANWLRNGWVKKNVTIQLGEIEEFLTKSPNFSGTDTLGQGDIMMSYPLIQLVHSDAFGSYPVGPHTLAWIDKIRARPAYQRARARLDQAKL